MAVTSICGGRGSAAGAWRRLRTTLCGVAVLLCAGLASAAGTDSEDALREAIKAGAAHLLEQGDLAAYDREASALRDSRDLTPGGIWKLYLFYKGVDHIAPNAPHSPLWAQVKSAASGYRQAHPDSPSALMAEVRVLSAHADALRSNGGGQDNFDEAAADNERARELLDQYRQIGSRDPDWYVNRIVVMTTQDTDKAQVMALAREALDREPTYQPLLYVASNALLPRYGGSQALHQEFVALALAKSHETLGTQAYARIMFNIVRLDPSPIRALSRVGMDWPQLRASLAEITAAYPDPWNANAERAMACLVGGEADLKAATARTPQPLFSVAWYDRYENWPDCAARQAEARAPLTTGLRSFFLGAPVSAALLVTVTVAVLLCLLVLFVAARRSPAPESEDPHAVPGSLYSPSPMWRAGQLCLGLILGALGVAGAWGFGAVADFRDTAPALVLVFLATALACGGVMLMLNALRFHLRLRGSVLELHQLWGVRPLRLEELASRRLLTTQGSTVLVLRFTDPRRRPFKMPWMFNSDPALAAWLKAIPDSDELAARALEAEVRADARLGTTPEERIARYARTSRYLRYAMYGGPLLLAWSAWYPRPYWLLIAVLVLLPWACLLAIRLFPGVMQIGAGGAARRPDAAALLIIPVMLLALRAFQDIHTLDWHPQVRWIAAIAVLLGIALYRLGSGQPRKWSTVAFMGVLCVAYGYGSTVTADALLDQSRGDIYRTHVLARHVTTGRYRSYSLTVGPWGQQSGTDRVSVSRDLYAQVSAGSEVCIDVRPGALAVPWYAVTRCPS